MASRLTAYAKSPEGRAAVSRSQKARYADVSKRPWGQPGGEKSSRPQSMRTANAKRIRKTEPWKLGGNGRPRSWRQEKLASALGWESEYVVKTGLPAPTSYKIDVAELSLKIAIEVGNVASPLKIQWYADNGWTYLHFSNRMVEIYMEGVLQTVSSTISQLKGITTT